MIRCPQCQGWGRPPGGGRCACGGTGDVDPTHPRFAYRNFGRWQEKARAHGAYGSRYPVEVSDEHGRVTLASLICPEQPSRASLQFARYARLDPPAPAVDPRAGWRDVLDAAGVVRAYGLDPG